jgi:2',3'-cyclic-nucleotide 2'-phosphodiesterase (5'-nucleotidase family)
MTRRLWLGISLVLLLMPGLLLPQAPTTLVILHTNDMHGQVLPRNGSGGLAQLATAIRREMPDLLLDGGDMFTGTMASDEFVGKPMIEVMNRLGYAAAALGNHEFDYGIPELRNRLREARFPVLSANVTGVDEVQPYTILTVKGIRIGVIGLTVESLPQVTHPKNMKTIVVKDLIEAVRETLPKVRPLSDFQIAVAHISTEEQLKVAKAFPEIRLIVAGHPHAARATQVGQTLIVETGSSVQNVGKVTIRLSGKTPESIMWELLPLRNLPPDPEIQTVIAPYEKTIAARSAERLGESRAELRKSDTEESALNNMVADALRETTGAQIALQNVGGIRATLGRGPITRSAVFDIIPFQNTLVTMNLTGLQLKQLLNRRVLAVSGVRVSWDTTRPRGSQLVSVSLPGGQPLQDAAQYSVASNDFMAAGGDGLLELTQGTSTRDTGILLRDAIAAYLRKHPVVTATTDGRVTIRNR